MFHSDFQIGKLVSALDLQMVEVEEGEKMNGKYIILCCPLCHRVKAFGIWKTITAMDILQLKGRHQDWALEAYVCPDCPKEVGDVKAVSG